MNYWDIYAFIRDGLVRNVCVFHPDGSYGEANKFAHLELGPDAVAINVTYIPVAIGDTYKDGNFYRDGEMVKPIPSTDEKITELELALAELGSIVGGM